MKAIEMMLVKYLLLASAEDHLPLCADLAEETWEDERCVSGLGLVDKVMGPDDDSDEVPDD